MRHFHELSFTSEASAQLLAVPYEGLVVIHIQATISKGADLGPILKPLLKGISHLHANSAGECNE